jgi:hypothetical protein
VVVVVDVVVVDVEYSTRTTPRMRGFSWQWYRKIPGSGNRLRKRCCGFNAPESNDESSAVTVCCSFPELVHSTWSPGATLISSGEKKR